MAVAWGAAITAASGLASKLLGGDQSTSSSGTTETAAGQTVADATTSNSLDVTSNSNASWTNTASGTNTSSTTSASADPGVIATLKALASTAIGNSTDPSKTTGILSGFLQSAGDAIGAIFGQQSQAGIYNSASTKVESNDVLSRASADAASAVLGYKTSQEQIAASALGQLLQATATTKSNTQTNQASSVASGSVTDTTVGSTKAATDTNIQVAGTKGGTISNSDTQTGISVVCTWMYRNGMLDRKKYVLVSRDFAAKPSYIIQGYLTTVHPLLKKVQKKETSLVSKATLAVFRARTDYICGEKYFGGWCARAIVAIGCAPASLYFFLKEASYYVTA